MGADVVVVSTGIVLVVKGTYSAVVTDALVETIVVSEPVVVAVVDTDILVEAVVGAMVASEVGGEAMAISEIVEEAMMIPEPAVFSETVVKNCGGHRHSHGGPGGLRGYGRGHGGHRYRGGGCGALSGCGDIRFCSFQSLWRSQSLWWSLWWA